jgi:ribonuclease P protein component
VTLRASRFPMRRRNRLASAGQIRNVYESGRRATAGAAGCVGIIEDGGPPLVAVVAGRKLGGAVARNRAKRRLHAAIDPLVGRMAAGSRVVVGATSRTNEVDFKKLDEDLQAVLVRIGVLSSA